MSKSNQVSLKQIMTVIAIAIVLIVLSISAVYQFEQPINAQNMTGNQTGNQTGGLNLVPLRVIEEETQEEILGVSNREQLSGFNSGEHRCKAESSGFEFHHIKLAYQQKWLDALGGCLSCSYK